MPLSAQQTNIDEAWLGLDREQELITKTGTQSLLVHWPQHWMSAPGCTEGAEETQIGRGLHEGNGRRINPAESKIARGLLGR
jgi:hypothetical protein